MKNCLSTLVLTLALAVITTSLRAQTPFYTQDFSGGGIPAGWTTTDGSNQGILWEYCTGPNANCANLYGHAPFASTTAANGFMILDSDAAGQLNANHVSRLTTKAIDCSAAPKVFIKFESLIGVYTVPSDGAVLLKVSTNGSTWTTYNFLPGLDVNNRYSADPEITIEDVSSVAAGKSTVYFQWEWTGNYEYWWMLDDVNIFANDPTPANDLAIGNFFYPPSSFNTPVSQIATDTFGFYAYVTNKGTADQTNVTLYAQVLDFGNNALFTDSVKIDVLPAGYKDSLMTTPHKFAPALPIGTYSVVYFVAADAADGNPANNGTGDYFQVSDNIFAKEDGPTGGLTTGTGDYAVANLYQMSPASLDQYKVAGFQFTASTDSSVLKLSDLAVTCYLLQVQDSIASDFSNFDLTNILSSGADWVGLADYQFPTGAQDYEIQSVEINDINSGDPGVHVYPGKRYLAVISYTDANNQAYQAFNDATTHYFVSTLVYSGHWYTAGFGLDQNAVIRMALDLVTTTDEHQLAEGTLNIFPNPVKDVLNLKVNFSSPTDATVTIAEISGRVISTDDRKALTNDVLKYQLPQLPSGTYLARIATNAGTQTKKFVIQK